MNDKEFFELLRNVKWPYYERFDIVRLSDYKLDKNYIPVVTLHLDYAKRLVNSYVLLLAFCAHVCGVKPSDLCFSDLLRYIYKKIEEVEKKEKKDA